MKSLDRIGATGVMLPGAINTNGLMLPDINFKDKKKEE